MHKVFHRFNAVLLGLAVIGGCSGNPHNLQPVSGTVKYDDGTVPEAEYCMVQLQPVAPQTDKLGPRTASAVLNPDGTFRMMTFKPADGVVPGTYRVVLRIWKTHRGREPLLPAAYADPEATPIEPVVVKPGKNHFDFVVPHPAASP